MREAELVAAYEESGALPTLDAFAERHGIKRSTAEGDVLRLVESGLLPETTIAVPVVQAWLATHLPQAFASSWGPGDKSAPSYWNDERSLLM